MNLLPLRVKLFVLAKLSVLRRALLGKAVRALLIESEVGLLLVGVEDMQVGRKLSFEGAYSKAELSQLMQLVRPDSAVLVVGGHVGALAIPLAKACQSMAVIEPNPHSYRLLELNLLINRCQHVQALNLAASDKHEDLSFVASRTNSGGSKRLPKVRHYWYFYDQPDIITVPAAPLDEVFPDREFDLIVMDIEGSEYFALRGMPKLLTRAATLAVEFVPHHLANVAGVTVSEFVCQIYPYFTQLFIPSKNLSVDQSKFLPVLNTMFERGEVEEGLIFSKGSQN